MPSEQTPAQLPLPLPHRPAFGLENFVISDCNRDAVAWIDRWPDWPGHALAIYGPPGCGKTHLGHVWQARANAVFTARPDAALAERHHAVVLDAPSLQDERALLHLYNRMRETGGFLLLLSVSPPARWKPGLPDLASRLGSVPAIGIEAPDDRLLAAVIAKHFADRQIVAGSEAVDYMLRHIDRSFDAARRMTAAIDAAALAQGRPVTVPLIRALLADFTQQ